MEKYDIIVVGAGPAGISAAITAKLRNKKVLLIGNKDVSDKVSKAHEILNYPGIPNVTGAKLAENLKNHLEVMKIEHICAKVNVIYSMGSYFGIQLTTNEMLQADSVILATGIVQSKALSGEDEFLGRGVSYCATCDAQFFRDKNVAVIGYNKEAQKEAKYLSEIVNKVIYIPMSKDELELPENIEIINEKPEAIQGNMMVEKLITSEGEHAVDGVFILRDAVSPKKLVPGLEFEGAHVKVNLQMQTNIKGLFACGDITGTPYQYIKAAGQGNVAALSAVEYLSGR